MNITVFTGNQPRHIALVNKLSLIADKVYVIQECSTVFPGINKDFYDNSPTMKTYFQYVRNAEKEIFGDISFLKGSIDHLSLKDEDLSMLPYNVLAEALKSDYYVVFGSSFIKGWLIDFLIEHKAVNIHMGVSPYFRGCSCNFWAIYCGYPELVGATIHLLSKGLDSGDILFHALPKPEYIDAFTLGMKAVEVAQKALVQTIENGSLYKYVPNPQDRTKEIKYARNSDFSDDVARKYLDDIISADQIMSKIAGRDMSMLYNAIVL